MKTLRKALRRMAKRLADYRHYRQRSHGIIQARILARGKPMKESTVSNPFFIEKLTVRLARFPQMHLALAYQPHPIFIFYSAALYPTSSISHPQILYLQTDHPPELSCSTPCFPDVHPTLFFQELQFQIDKQDESALYDWLERCSDYEQLHHQKTIVGVK